MKHKNPPVSPPNDVTCSPDTVTDPDGNLLHPSTPAPPLPPGLTPRRDLVPPEVEVALANVLAYGTQQFNPREWEKGIPWSKLLFSTIKHLLRFAIGWRIHQGSGLPRLWHALANLAFLVALESRANTDSDDLA